MQPNANAPPGTFAALLEDGLAQPEETGPAQEPEPAPEPRPTVEPECDCGTHSAYHSSWCLLRASKSEAEWKQIAAQVLAATAPKSRHRGRITDHDSARKEIEGMARLAKDDERLSPCAAFVYGLITSRGWRHGSVLVMAAADYLAAKSNGAYTVKQCRYALDTLETLGYIEPKRWSYVKRRDPGLYAYAKRSHRGTEGGRWPNAYLLKQDPPGNEDARPDEENPILEMFGLQTA